MIIYFSGPRLRTLKLLKKLNKSLFKKDLGKKKDLQCLYQQTWQLTLFNTTDVRKECTNLNSIYLIEMLVLLVNIDDSGPARKKRAEADKSDMPTEQPVQPRNDRKKESDKASDDFVFEKFRRQFRR